MRIGDSRGSTIGRGGQPSREAPAAASSRALTVVAAPARREMPTLTRGDAAFLAHLIATDAQAPQTRTKRRADPAEALAAYRAAAGMVS
jgi:hypothetical protein